MQFNGSTSIVQKTDADVVGSSPYFSLVCWIHPNTIGETQGRILTLDEAGNAITVLLISGFLRFSRVWSGGTVNWDVAAGTAYALNRTTGIFLTYDGTATGNTPTLYTQMLGQDGGLVRRTMSLISSAPSGSLTTPNAGYAVGNRAATDRTFDGQISYVQAFDRILSPYEGQAALRQPGIIKAGLRLNLHLDRDTIDRSGRGQHGVGSAVVPGSMPPVRPYVRGKRIYTVAQTVSNGSIAGTSNGSAVASGSLKGWGRVDGSASGLATVSGSLESPGNIAGTSDGVATVSGTLKGTGRIVAVFYADSTCSGNLEGYARCDGSASGSATVSGALQARTGMSGTANGAATTSGTLKGKAALEGSAAGQATVTGRMASDFIAGVIAGIATASGHLIGRAGIDGSASGLATVLAELVGTAEMAGSASGQATVAGILAGLAALEGSASGIASASASLSAQGVVLQYITTIVFGTRSVEDEFNPTFLSR